jgi:hypothetical protein
MNRASRPKPPSAKFREWLQALGRIESLADAAQCMEPGGVAQGEVLRKLVREAQALKYAFARQAGKV